MKKNKLLIAFLVGTMLLTACSPKADSTEGSVAITEEKTDVVEEPKEDPTDVSWCQESIDALNAAKLVQRTETTDVTFENGDSTLWKRVCTIDKEHLLVQEDSTDLNTGEVQPICYYEDTGDTVYYYWSDGSTYFRSLSRTSYEPLADTWEIVSGIKGTPSFEYVGEEELDGKSTIKVNVTSQLEQSLYDEYLEMYATQLERPVDSAQVEADERIADDLEAAKSLTKEYVLWFDADTKALLKVESTDLHVSRVSAIMSSLAFDSEAFLATKSITTYTFNTENIAPIILPTEFTES